MFITNGDQTENFCQTRFQLCVSYFIKQHSCSETYNQNQNLLNSVYKRLRPQSPKLSNTQDLMINVVSMCSLMSLTWIITVHNRFISGTHLWKHTVVKLWISPFCGMDFLPCMVWGIECQGRRDNDAEGVLHQNSLECWGLSFYEGPCFPRESQKIGSDYKLGCHSFMHSWCPFPWANALVSELEILSLCI